MDLGVLLESRQGSPSSSRVGACTGAFLRAVAAVSRFPSRGSRDQGPYMTTGKTIALARWTFVSKVISLLFNMLSRSVIDFLPRSKRLNFMAVHRVTKRYS